MRDRYGRSIDYMRISVTERCNYRCFYCMPQDREEVLEEEGLISSEEIIDLVEAGAKLGIKKVRITGGEPLIRRDIEEILTGISRVEGIDELCITTNGSLLYERMDLLKRCGVSRINVSLDTLKEERFQRITKYGRLDMVWKGIEEAIGAGIEVRINSVIIEDVNRDEIVDLAMLTDRYPLDVRFIELMPIGEGKRYQGVPGSTIRDEIEKDGRRMSILKRDGASEYYRMEEAKGRIGFINPLSNCFCEECNRIRITSKGEVKQCLNRKANLSLRELDQRKGPELVEIMAKEIYNKPEKHEFHSWNSLEENKNMNQIGG